VKTKHVQSLLFLFVCLFFCCLSTQFIIHPFMFGVTKSCVCVFVSALSAE
jgi:hypothetical protein